MYVSEWYSCVEGCSDEGVSKRVWADPLFDSCSSSEPPNDSRRLMSVKSCSAAGGEDGSVFAGSDCEIKGSCGARSEWYQFRLSAFAYYSQSVVASFHSHISDVSSQRFRYSESVEAQETCQSMITTTRESGLDQKGSQGDLPLAFFL